ncbi:hypothetical protein PQU92_17220 [Asticcacaulis sp. BYS171W]|uniref:Uncharacterized protein n=1 Tax=Asticcacaulis aquaticus TaxID=2984212 RepID=A0ABT5HYG5_9CAUL|nr:hypothetical protein [Asticcacaulis aquaticus]MDC7685029.1 hypothetical protein [Asticcacaulis aquaticus]
MRDIAHIIWISVGLILLVGVTALALWRGGRDERIAAVIIFIASCLTPLFQDKVTYFPGAAALILDGFITVYFIVLSLMTRKVWTLAAAVCMINTMTAHLVHLMTPEMNMYSYLTGIGFWGGIALYLAIGGGVWEERLRRRYKISSL